MIGIISWFSAQFSDSNILFSGTYFLFSDCFILTSEHYKLNKYKEETNRYRFLNLKSQNYAGIIKNRPV